jgi:hypothetical protein
MFRPIAAVLPEAGKPASGPDDTGIRRVFMVLHGFYGNLFLSKFATGHVTEQGEDEGIANARRVWAHGLREFDGETVKTALARCQTAHPEYPPSMPQFVALCASCKPREVYRPPVHAPALEMSQELREQRIREHREKAAALMRQIKAEEEGLSGLTLLKQAIAQAVADAGGDEAATLLQMDRILSPMGKA